jgi:hypothetical protein
MGKLVSLFASGVMVTMGLTAAAQAEEPAVQLGEVTAQAAARDDIDVEALKAMAADAVKGLDASAMPRGSHAVVSVSVVRLESKAEGAAQVSCVVSATLRDRTKGSVFAVVQGTASGSDDPKRVHVLERATMGAAVRSAVARVPEAMRRRRR